MLGYNSGKRVSASLLETPPPECQLSSARGCSVPPELTYNCTKEELQSVLLLEIVPQTITQVDPGPGQIIDKPLPGQP
ncbi:hypothetical protein AVEN_66338-1 [Araneus ventricosus]|uniref:Uncharacterized protein n=1 Tax=Araneus ventricosus TaxID=182803 RepID=A0A4Y1ZR79_ARAVE|nr:hypothetical protein AVEN_66338-1 [Araneus ventricosus]